MEIYRFRDKVVVNPPDGPTFYLTAEEAVKFHRALTYITAEIISGVPFKHSNAGTFRIDTDGRI